MVSQGALLQGASLWRASCRVVCSNAFGCRAALRGALGLTRTRHARVFLVKWALDERCSCPDGAFVH